MAGRRKKPLDFSDEKVVLKEMAKALDEEKKYVFVEPAKNYESFGVGTVWNVQIGTQEWFVVEDDGVADALALEVVKRQLNEEPELFSQSFIENYIDKENLAKQLRSEVEERQREDLSGYNTGAFWGVVEHLQRSRLPANPMLLGFYIPKLEDDDGKRDPTEEEFEVVIEALVDSELSDPIGYLVEIFGVKDATAKAIEIGGIDIEAAAKEAVSSDGPGHYLSGYDSNIHSTPGGFVYWRQN